MHGQGPIRGKSKPLGWLIGGLDPIACETVCCRLIGLEPGPTAHRPAARRIGFGCSDLGRIEIVGDALPPAPCPDFELAEPDAGEVLFRAGLPQHHPADLLLAQGVETRRKTDRSRSDAEQTRRPAQ